MGQWQTAAAQQVGQQKNRAGSFHSKSSATGARVCSTASTAQVWRHQHRGQTCLEKGTSRLYSSFSSQQLPARIGPVKKCCFLFFCVSPSLLKFGISFFSRCYLCAGIYVALVFSVITFFTPSFSCSCFSRFCLLFCCTFAVPASPALTASSSSPASNFKIFMLFSVPGCLLLVHLRPSSTNAAADR